MKKNLSPAALAKRREYTRKWKKRNRRPRTVKEQVKHTALMRKYRALDGAFKYIYINWYYSRDVTCRIDFCNPMDILISMEET